MDVPRPLEQFIPVASTVYHAMKPTICAKIIPGFWCLGLLGFFFILNLMNGNLIECLLVFVV